jgi:Subtilase family
MAAAKRPSGFVLVRGTSFASPIVAGLLSQRLRAVDKAAAEAAIGALAREAINLGSPSPNTVYGYGLVGEALRRQPALAALHIE